MRFSVRWLKNYLKTDASLEQILDALVTCGLEVEEVIDLGMVSGKLVTGEILRIDAIAGADKIRLCTVMADDKEPLRIVCGADNIKEGDIVPVARFGMKFPGGFELKPRKIKGIEGQGMLCSTKELGIADDADGIWILPPGTPVAEPYDAAVEISITPNRPDALSIVGVARDLAARLSVTTGRKVSLQPPPLTMNESGDRVDSIARVTVEARRACPRYTARVVKGVKVGPSPRWMQVVLETAGLRPINNIVDITNYVLLELGHPLHAFDLDRVAGRHIIVRQARDGERITTLDEQTLTLVPEDLLICDAEKPVALAGVMGGGNSEISGTTTDVLLECAYFHPPVIRKTSKRHDKSTDSSYRFERGTDPKGLTGPLNRAAQLIAELAGGTVLRGVIDVVGPVPDKEPISLRVERVNQVLGLSLAGREITDALTPLGFEVLRTDGRVMLIQPPSFRPDVSMEVDIIEELARILGYERIAEEKLELPGTVSLVSPLDQARARLAEASVAQGLHQAVNFSFIPEGGNALAGLADGHQVRVVNPITSDMGVMRRSLLPSLLQNVAHNLNHGVEEVALFEIGHTYKFTEAEKPAEEPDPRTLELPAEETPVYGAVLSGGVKPNWKEPVREADFFRIKGLAEYLLAVVGANKVVVDSNVECGFLHPGRKARFLVKGKPVALFGEIHPALLKELDIRKRVCYLEIPLDVPELLQPKAPRCQPVGRYPAVARDIALVVEEHVKAMELERTIRKTGGELLTSVRLFDLYEGPNIDQGRKSLAFALTFRSPERTLKEAEVNEVFDKIVDRLARDHGAALRA